MKMEFINKIILTCFLLTLVSCASTPMAEQYPAGTNAQEVTPQLSAEMDAARNQQMDVLAPKNFAAAEEHLQKAKDLQTKDNFKNEKALEQLGLAKAYLVQAKSTYKTAAPLLNEISDARQAALNAGAIKNHKKDLKNLDDDFLDLSQKIEKGNADVDLKEKSRLQKKYLDLELAVIKSEKLMESRSLMKKAKEISAEQLAPKTWANAESKISNVEAVITADRHDEAAINGAVILAQGEARKAYEVAKTARNAKSRNNEDVALDIYGKKGEISDLNKQVAADKTEEKANAKELSANAEALSANAQELSANAKQLSAKDQELAQADQQRKSLEAEKRFNQSLQDAQKNFNSSDAVVYRQGNDLVIRMKSVNFTTGKAELPPHALGVLSKTKQLINDLNAKKVIVEGHTDAVGSHEVNMRISQERAETVAKFLAADHTIDSGNIETRGMGDEKPLTSNKTKAGRSENRRVDIVITPAPLI